MVWFLITLRGHDFALPTLLSLLRFLSSRVFAISFLRSPSRHVGRQREPAPAEIGLEAETRDELT